MIWVVAILACYGVLRLVWDVGQRIGSALQGREEAALERQAHKRVKAMRRNYLN